MYCEMMPCTVCFFYLSQPPPDVRYDTFVIYLVGWDDIKTKGGSYKKNTVLQIFIFPALKTSYFSHWVINGAFCESLKYVFSGSIPVLIVSPLTWFMFSKKPISSHPTVYTLL